MNLEEEVTTLQESAALPFKSNEQAVVISEQVDEEVTEIVEPRYSNEFINEDMLAYMPKN